MFTPERSSSCTRWERECHFRCLDNQPLESRITTERHAKVSASQAVLSPRGGISDACERREYHQYVMDVGKLAPEACLAKFPTSPNAFTASNRYYSRLSPDAQ
jgi:hypothetical protein